MLAGGCRGLPALFASRPLSIYQLPGAHIQAERTLFARICQGQQLHRLSKFHYYNGKHRVADISVVLHTSAGLVSHYNNQEHMLVFFWRELQLRRSFE